MKKSTLIRYIPPAIVVLFASLLTFGLIFYTLPKIYGAYPSKLALILWLYEVICYCMLIWSWLYASISDPGKLETDLKERGLLDRIKQGDIPYCLKDLPICPNCRLPMPPRCRHCRDCNTCVLRRDHHCGVTGQCIGDRNFKAFILTFFYGMLLGLGHIFTGLFAVKAQTSDLFSMLIICYGGIMGLSLGCFIFFSLTPSFENFFKPSYLAADPRNRKIPFMKGAREVLKSFGTRWYQRLIPIQNHSTDYAWPDIEWNYESTLL